MAIISEKDEVIANMNLEIQRLIKETKKLNRSLSQEKDGRRRGHRDIHLDIKLNPNTAVLSRNQKEHQR